MVSDVKGGELKRAHHVPYVLHRMQHDTVMWTVQWHRIAKSSPPDLHPRPRSMVEGTDTWESAGKEGGVTVLGSFTEGGEGVWRVVCGMVWVLLLMPGQRRRALFGTVARYGTDGVLTASHRQKESDWE